MFLGSAVAVELNILSLFTLAGQLLDLREVFVNLVETWRDSRRQGDNTLLPAALLSLLLAVDAAGQRRLLETARTLIDKVLC
jgi:hypothetical protein